MNNEGVEKVKAFLAKEDLLGTELKLKESILKLDVALLNTKKELKEAVELVSKKESEVFALAQRLEALALLALESQTEIKTVSL